jgi:hypothetical protein
VSDNILTLPVPQEYVTLALRRLDECGIKTLGGLPVEFLKYLSEKDIPNGTFEDKTLRNMAASMIAFAAAVIGQMLENSLITHVLTTEMDKNAAPQKESEKPS